MKRLRAQRRAAKAQSRRVVPVPREGPLQCTHQQEGLWFLHQMDPSSAMYHIPFVVRLRGALDVEALRRALLFLVARHEALRTRFVAEGGVPRQVIGPPPPSLSMPVVDVAAADVDQWVVGEVDRPMDLAAGVFRADLGRIAADEHVLLMVVHHIAADGWSVGILAGELSYVYSAEARGVAPTLPALAVQPADHAAWQRAWLDGAELERQVGYWREALAGLAHLDLPTDRPRPAEPTGAGVLALRPLPADLSVAARAYARTNGHRSSS